VNQEGAEMRLKDIKIGERYAIRFPARPPAVPRPTHENRHDYEATARYYDGLNAWESTIEAAVKHAREQGETVAAWSKSWPGTFNGVPAVVREVGVPLSKRQDGVVVELTCEQLDRDIYQNMTLNEVMERGAPSEVVTRELVVHAPSVIAPWHQYALDTETARFAEELDRHDRFALEREWEESPEGKRYEQERRQLWDRHLAEDNAIRERHEAAMKAELDAADERHAREIDALNRRFPNRVRSRLEEKYGEA
jgi:hypothetical protein